MLDAALLDGLRRTIGRIQRRESRGRPAAIAFGVPDIDGRLPSGGIARGALHEMSGAGPDIEHGAASALLIAGVLARVRGKVLWAVERRDLFAPALAAVGLSPDRLVLVEAGDAASVLLVMEEGLRHRGLAGVVGEVSGRMALTASRRLQLAAEASGVVAFALRRSRRHSDPELAAPSASVTRWKVAALPSAPPVAHLPLTPGLGRARWRLDLVRCRGGEAHSWIVEACDAQGRLALFADLADRPAAEEPGRAAG